MKHLQGELIARMCVRCGILKSTDHFDTQETGFGGKKAYCRECLHPESVKQRRRAAVKACALKNPERTREVRKRSCLKHWYGITLEEFKQKLQNQNGVCAICGGPPTRSKHYLSVDHNHENGTVRGLLCTNCNRMIGSAKENVSTLKAAISYLEKYNSVAVLT